MKTFLFLTGILMFSASVYGIMEYRKQSSTKAFNTLHEKQVHPVPDLNEQKKAPPPPPSPGETKEERLNKVPFGEEAKTITKATEGKKQKQEKKKKFLSVKKFSRAALP